MYAYMSVCIYIHICMYVGSHIYICMSIPTHIRYMHGYLMCMINTHVYACTYVIYVCVYMPTYIHQCINIPIPLCLHASTYRLICFIYKYLKIKINIEYIHTHKCIHPYICLCVMCIYINAPIYIYVSIDTYMHK